MSYVEITKPNAGKVVIELTYQDAEILLRVLGLTNTGNLTKVSPNLLGIVDDMVNEFGRNNCGSARRYMAETRGNQVFITDLEDMTHSK